MRGGVIDSRRTITKDMSVRLAQVRYQRQCLWGIVEHTTLRVLAAPPFGRLALSAARLPLRACRFLAPVVPSKIILVGLNYHDHAREMRMPPPAEPVIFFKPPSAIIGPGQPIIYPPQAGRVDYEGELAVVIKKKTRGISAARARQAVLGYTCLNDVTARDIQARDSQWARAKSFDSFCPIGPWIETDCDPAALTLRTVVNGRLCQQSATQDVLFDVYALISFISRIMTLYPGDVIATGTPAGIGPLAVGDRVTVSIQGIGDLTNPVRAPRAGY